MSKVDSELNKIILEHAKYHAATVGACGVIMLFVDLIYLTTMPFGVASFVILFSAFLFGMLLSSYGRYIKFLTNLAKEIGLVFALASDHDRSMMRRAILDGLAGAQQAYEQNKSYDNRKKVHYHDFLLAVIQYWTRKRA